MSFTNSAGRNSGFEIGTINRYNPQQNQLFNQLFGYLGPESYLGKLAGGQGDFSDIEAPALRQFSGMQGNLASRFSGMGLGGRHSSGFQNASTSAASQFAQELQSNRQGLQRQALGDLFNMSNLLLNNSPYQHFAMPKKPSFLESLLGGLGGMGAQFGGSAAGAGGNLAILKLMGLL